MIVVKGYTIVGFISMCGIVVIELTRVLSSAYKPHNIYVVCPHSLRYGYSNHPIGSGLPYILHNSINFDFAELYTYKLSN